jgi:hypothetical protein
MGWKIPRSSRRQFHKTTAGTIDVGINRRISVAPLLKVQRGLCLSVVSSESL